MGGVEKHRLRCLDFILLLVGFKAYTGYPNIYVCREHVAEARGAPLFGLPWAGVRASPPLFGLAFSVWLSLLTLPFFFGFAQLSPRFLAPKKTQTFSFFWVGGVGSTSLKGIPVPDLYGQDTRLESVKTQVYLYGQEGDGFMGSQNGVILEQPYFVC
jgi:hypothetical protein